MAIKCKLQPSAQSVEKQSDQILFNFFQNFSIFNASSSSQLVALFSFLGVILGVIIWFTSSSSKNENSEKESKKNEKNSILSSAVNTKSTMDTRISSNSDEKTIYSEQKARLPDQKFTPGLVQRKPVQIKTIETILESQNETDDKVFSVQNKTHISGVKSLPVTEVKSSTEISGSKFISSAESSIATAKSSPETFDSEIKISSEKSAEVKNSFEKTGSKFISSPETSIEKEKSPPETSNSVIQNSCEKSSIELKNTSENQLDDATNSKEENSYEKCVSKYNTIRLSRESSIEKTSNLMIRPYDLVVEKGSYLSNRQKLESRSGKIESGSSETLSDRISMSDTAKPLKPQAPIAPVKALDESSKSQESIARSTEDLKPKSMNNSVLDLLNVKHINAIEDHFKDLNEISTAIQRAGLEKSQLIFGIDFTISNLENGTSTFNGRSLHYQDEANIIKNPYQKVIEILGKTLEAFDMDGRIPAFGFGDSKTKDRKVFPFSDEGYCLGFQDVLEKYNVALKGIQLSGPTNFAPLIKEAIKIVKNTKQYHILVIVADGQVTNERQTREAIVEASKYPLSIIMVGVGDGPWHTMNVFDDSLPKRQFDNFQFVNYHEVTSGVENPDETFALHTLMEIPDQYKAIKELNLLQD